MVSKMQHLRLLNALFVVFTMVVAPTVFAQTNRTTTNASPDSVLDDSLTVRALKATPNKATLYEIAFLTRDTLATDAKILLSFPPECDLSALEIVGSSNINGGWTLRKNRRQATLRRTGLGDAIAPGKRVGVKLGLIKNPTDFNTAHRVDVQIRPSAKKPTGAKRRVEVGFK